MERKKLSNFSYKKVLSFAYLAFFSLLFINTALNLILDMFIREYKPYFLPTNIENCSIISYILNLAGAAYIGFIEIICIIIQLVGIVFIGDFDNEEFKLSTSIIVPIMTQVCPFINTIIQFIINKDLAKVQFVCISVMVLINFVFLFL